jgi:hypothetical protein
MRQRTTPDLVPILSRGKHRSPRKGACFMELASYLAGERWSDHPACTHPVLAALARDVNDHVSDAARNRLSRLIPEVIGLSGEDARVDAWIAREVALTALPVVPAEKQNVMAVAVLSCERRLAALEGRPGDELTERSRVALAEVPQAARWARQFPVRFPGGVGDFNRRGAVVIVHVGVASIATATIRDPDSLLVDLLDRTITDARGWLGHRPAPVAEPVAQRRWQEVVALTHR